MPQEIAGAWVIDWDVPNQVRTDIKEVKMQCPELEVIKSFVKGVREEKEASTAISSPDID